MSREKTKPMMNGLNEHRRIGWRDPYNRAFLQLVNEGFALNVIAEHSQLTMSQVRYRLRKRGISVMDFRNGKTPKAVAVLSKYSISYKEKTG